MIKKLLFILLFFTLPAQGIHQLCKLFKKDSPSVEESINTADFRSVMDLVHKDVDPQDLNYYLELSQGSFGRPPKASVYNYILGSVKIILGFALLYKTGDYFKQQYTAAHKDFIRRYTSPHNVLMDLACLSGLISSYGSVSSGINNIDPRSNYKKQLLINLYLKSLKTV